MRKDQVFTEQQIHRLALRMMPAIERIKCLVFMGRVGAEDAVAALEKIIPEEGEK